ncbi:hypothetical protein IW140_004588 [Coemansia sp. RSA 1813]|nr:hypothetical protein EV178_004629 [Coemansia sp. RSA 1646]KAJ1766591.1 hypothetical protein LPJ74_005811 [Coemansia sp. RSA 1843]KAJ2087719.1 hypothetical protein IW138_004747 [Coemansia sp. RSA 986]KAJ2213064.1 hypothetical protein EV179_004125 [Coemansia sp. RSA 487]KAJ2567240.1 hypothetical protein IW140_004588 [Coemansia sp. RSA 1813]
MSKQQSNIWVAASDGNLARVKEIVESDKQQVNAKDENGYTPLHAASSWKHTDLLKYLIANGGDVNIVDADGDTPLHICEDVECAQILLDNGADPKIENHEGLTPVHTTLENEATDVTKLLCEKLGISVPTLSEVRSAEQEDGENEDITDSKVANLSNWIMQQVDDKSETDEEALREMVTNYIMQNLRVAGGKKDDTVAATVATSNDRRSQDNETSTVAASTTKAASKPQKD